MASLVAATLDQAEKFLPQAESISGFIPGVGPTLVSVEQIVGLALPSIITAVRFLAAETGNPPLQVLEDFLNHITPGAPGAPALT
jgi:hypothetical protein